MTCSGCGERISILQALIRRGHRCSAPLESENGQSVWVERLLNATPLDDPEQKKALKSNGSASATDHPAIAPQEATDLPQTPVDSESAAEDLIPCTGSWRCCCPRCLGADRSIGTGAFSDLSA